METPTKPRTALSTAIRAATWLGAALTLVAVFALLFGGLDAQPLRGDEGLYSLVVADVLEGDSPGRLGFEGRHYLNKPPLAFYAMALSSRLLGLSERALRLPSAIASGLLALLVLAVGSRRAGLAPAAIGLLVMVTAPRLLDHHGLRAAVTEPWLLLWTLLTIVAYGRWRSGRLRSFAPVVVLTVVSALTKGLVGPALIALTLTLCEALLPAPEPRAGALRQLARRLTPGAIVLGAGALTYLSFWLWNYPSLAQLARFLRRDWWQRASGTLQAEHLRGATYFLERLVFDFGPWLLLAVPALLPPVWRRLRKAGDAEGLAIRLLPLVALAAFSIPRSKLVWYLYPAYPAIALVIAEGLPDLASRLRLPRRVAPLLSWVLLALLVPRYLGALETVGRRSRGDLRHLAEIVSERPDAVVLADPRLELDAHRPREWHRFALRYRLAAVPLGPTRPLPDSGCRFVITPDPATLEALPSPPPPAVRVRKQPGRDPDLWIVDLCGGEFAAEAAGAQRAGSPQTRSAGAGAPGGT